MFSNSLYPDIIFLLPLEFRRGAPTMEWVRSNTMDCKKEYFLGISTHLKTEPDELPWKGDISEYSHISEILISEEFYISFVKEAGRLAQKYKV